MWNGGWSLWIYKSRLYILSIIIRFLFAYFELFLMQNLQSFYDYKVKSLFYEMFGQQQMHHKIEISQEIETLYLVNIEFGHQTFQHVYSRFDVKSRLYFIFPISVRILSSILLVF